MAAVKWYIFFGTEERIRRITDKITFLKTNVMANFTEVMYCVTNNALYSILNLI